jgi:hypothetical protein
MDAGRLKRVGGRDEEYVYLVDSAFERTEVLERVLLDPCRNGKSRSQTECCESIGCLARTL